MRTDEHQLERLYCAEDDGRLADLPQRLQALLGVGDIEVRERGWGSDRVEAAGDSAQVVQSQNVGNVLDDSEPYFCG